MKGISDLVVSLSRDSIISKQWHAFECIHVICAFKHNADIIHLYRISSASQELK